MKTRFSLKTYASLLVLPLFLLAFAAPAAAARHKAAAHKAAPAKPAPKKDAAPAPAAPVVVPKDWEGEILPSDTPFKAPNGYTVHVLDPVGARILKPKGWFYGRMYDPRGYTWILSHEDPSAKGGYQTGLRIQLLQGVKTGTNKPLKEFANDYFEKKKTGDAKVLKPDLTKTCGGKGAGAFHRNCLETEETIPGQGKTVFHLAYTTLWNDDTDTVIIMTFGAPVDAWKKSRDTAAQMIGRLDLPDFSKKMKEAQARAPGCPDGVSRTAQETLNKYVEAGGKAGKGLFTVAGLGSDQYFIGPEDAHPVSVPEFAAMLKASPDYVPATKIILLWSYSAAGEHSFADRLSALMNTEVVGAEGPLWWYPDGTTLVTDPEKGLVWPAADNVIGCFRGDGNIVGGQACQKLAASLDHPKAIFGNTLLVPDNCAELGRMSFDAVMGQRNESFQLFLFYSFVKPNRDKASTWLSLAAYGRQPLAEYFAAQEMRGRDKGLYRQLLKDAARDGDKKAARELGLADLNPSSLPKAP